MLDRKFTLATLSVAAITALTQADKTELDSLYAQVAQLEKQEHQRAINATIRDAQSRSELLKADNFTAGWNNGFTLGSADGRYLFRYYGVIQFRNVTNASNGFFLDDHDEEDGQTLNGFEIRRTKVGLRGNIADPRLGYDFRLAFLRTGGTELEVAFLTWKASAQWTFKAGQYKSDWTHEETTIDARQLAAERSMLNTAIGGVRTLYEQGVSAMFASDNLRAELGFTDGALSGNSTWDDEQPTGYDFGTHGRIEYKFNGDWKSYEDFSAINNRIDLLVIGAGFDWSLGSDNPAGDGYDLRHAIDIQWENTSGAGLYGAYVANFSDTGDDQRYDWGLLAQAGYLIADTKWEIFARYSFMTLNNLPDGEDFQEITGGLNYFFFNSHAFKFTCDLNYLPDGAVIGTGGLGYIADDEEQWALRAQIQIQI